MYFWIVRLQTRISSFSNSPRMRSAPQRRLFLAISLIKAMVSANTFACVDFGFDFCLQKRRKPRRCQHRSVSGCTMKSACFHVRTILASRTRSNRSAFVHAGRFTCRFSMMSCWRKSAFSAISSDLLLPRSAMVPSNSKVFGGLVQRTKRVWSLSKQRRISRLREERAGFTERVSPSLWVEVLCHHVRHMITPFDVTLSYLHLQAVEMPYRSYDGYFLNGYPK